MKIKHLMRTRILREVRSDRRPEDLGASIYNKYTSAVLCGWYFTLVKSYDQNNEIVF